LIHGKAHLTLVRSQIKRREKEWGVIGAQKGPLSSGRLMSWCSESTKGKKGKLTNRSRGKKVLILNGEMMKKWAGLGHSSESIELTKVFKS